MATISRTVLREQVKDVLLQRIASGELQPGERLVETRIAQELGTSQAPVREALRDLQLLRLVESEPFRGSRVRVFDEEERDKRRGGTPRQASGINDVRSRSSSSGSAFPKTSSRA